MSEEKKPKGNILAQAWLVILLALVYGTGLAGIHIWLNPRIQSQKKEKTRKNVPVLLEGAVLEKTERVSLEGPDGEPVLILRGVDNIGRTVGWLVPASGPGYNEPIEIVVGLSPEAETITGIAILAQKETPGLGDRITEASFRQNFAGAPTDHSLKLQKGEATQPYEVTPITGATVSSQSVTNIVNQVIDHYKPQIQKLNE